MQFLTPTIAFPVRRFRIPTEIQMTANLLILATIGVVHFVAAMSPGPSFLITARTAIAHSRADGVKVALGIGLGTIVWSSAALMGLNFLSQQYHWLFIFFRVAGALYLLWIACQIFWHAADPIEMNVGANNENGNDALLRGFLTQISNPKVAVFFGSIFVAMLPSEVPGWMVATLIAIVTANEIVWYSVVSLFFGSPPVRHFYLIAKRWIDRVTGAFLGFLSLRLLWQAGNAA
jgi:threonine/homoserine/homoserine lactone efflux protein